MRVFLAIALLILPVQAFAQEVLGQSLIEGRNITIFADGTWEYADADAGGCRLVARNVEFCGDRALWESSTPPNNDVAASFRRDSRHYGQMIIEELGTVDGLTPAFMRDTVIENAALVIGRDAKEITIIDTYRTRVSGRSVETVVYAFNIDGLDVTYANGILTSPNRTMQLMTYAITDTFTDQHRDIHADFLSNIRIGK